MYLKGCQGRHAGRRLLNKFIIIKKVYFNVLSNKLQENKSTFFCAIKTVYQTTVLPLETLTLTV